MNAREKISITLQASQFAADQAEHLSHELYDAVAHELAEKIREENGRRYLGAPGAADLIDPEVRHH